MEDITGDIHKYSNAGLETSQLLASPGTPQYMNARVYECMDNIERSIIRTHRQRNIEFEWEQGTRIIERCIMIIYVTLTVGFAFFMLGDSGGDLRLTEEVMDRVKR